MRVFFEIAFEMVVVLIIIEIWAAMLAVPVWWSIHTFLWVNVGYLGVMSLTYSLLLGVCMVVWVVEISKGVNL